MVAIECTKEIFERVAMAWHRRQSQKRWRSSVQRVNENLLPLFAQRLVSVWGSTRRSCCTFFAQRARDTGKRHGKYVGLGWACPYHCFQRADKDVSSLQNNVTRWRALITPILTMETRQLFSSVLDGHSQVQVAFVCYPADHGDEDLLTTRTPCFLSRPRFVALFLC